MILVGSKAAEYWGINRRESKDIDYFLHPGETAPFGDCYTLPLCLYTKIKSYGKPTHPDVLYTIKCSHLAWDIHWDKTKLDIIHMQYNGCKIIPEIYHSLKDLWEKEHGDKSFLSLNKPKDYFFDDYVTYKHDHDYLHELVAYPNPPMYLSVLKDGQDVLTDKRKFGKLTFDQKIRLFREEITVIAAERWLFNDQNTEANSWYRAYQLSLKKTITRLTKGWATDFIIQNLDKFILPDYSYFKHMLETLEEPMINETQFETLKEIYAPSKSIDEFVMDLASGDFGPDYISPEKPDFKTASKEETSAYWAECRKRFKAAVDDFETKTGYKHLVQEGGGEGGTEYCFGVFELDGKRYKAEWSYFSHEGFDDWGCANTLKEVKPVEKTITVWE